MIYLNMGDTILYQPLTKEDKITVLLYRAGIVLSALSLCGASFLGVTGIYPGYSSEQVAAASPLAGGILLLFLYFSAGLSVFFIHLYIGKFHRLLKKIYFIAFACLIALFILGKGNPSNPLFGSPPIQALFLFPLSLCLGFITAKEAFCFRLLEGYLLAIAMPAYVFFYSVGALAGRSAAFGLTAIAAILVLFVIRKVFMQPLHLDIGDKTAYQP